MKRSKLGDLYCMKVPHGYKLYQWAYTVPQFCDYIRVFPEVYDEIPADLDSIVNSAHSYIIGTDVRWAYRKKISTLLGNFAVPDQYPFPKYSLVGGAGHYKCVRDNSTGKWITDFVGDLNELPEEYRDIDMIASFVTTPWLMFLFDTDFDLTKKWSSFLPYERINYYIKIVDRMVDEE